MIKSSLIRGGPPMAFLVILLGGWELSVHVFSVEGWLLPAPSAIFERFLQTDTLWFHMRITLTEAFSGFAISIVLGIALAAAIVNFRVIERSVFPYVVLGQAIPIIAILPLLSIWLGFGIAPKIAIVSIITFAPIVINTVRGLRSADRLMLEFMRTIDAGRWEVFRKIQFPAALPFIFASFRIASPLALIGAVVGEFYQSDRGLGYLIVLAATQLRTDLLFVAVFVLGATGVALFALFGQLERMIIRWEPESGFGR